MTKDIRDAVSRLDLGPLSHDLRIRIATSLSDMNQAEAALRAAYDDVLTERIPDDMRRLIEELR